jgi:hypothetical protein
MGFRDIYNTLMGMNPPTPDQKKKLTKAMMTPPPTSPMQKLVSNTRKTQAMLDQIK